MPGLLELVERDLEFTLEDDVTGFGKAMVITSPVGVETPIVGQYTEHAAVEDPDTGLIIRARETWVTWRVRNMPAGFRVIHTDGAPVWRVALTDSQGVERVYSPVDVQECNAIGHKTVQLQRYGV